MDQNKSSFNFNYILFQRGRIMRLINKKQKSSLILRYLIHQFSRQLKVRLMAPQRVSLSYDEYYWKTEPVQFFLFQLRYRVLANWATLASTARRKHFVSALAIFSCFVSTPIFISGLISRQQSNTVNRGVIKQCRDILVQ